MHHRRKRPYRTAAFLALISSPLGLSGCDPTIQSTVENGVISVSTSALTSFFQAVTILIGERQDATDPNNG